MTRPTAVRQACLICLGMLTWACGARATATLPQADPPALPVATVPPPTETTAPEEVARRVADSRPDPVSRPEADARVDTDCELLTAPGVPIRTVALIDAVEASHAPHPTNDGERLLFRQLYDTLVRVDCEGRLRPGLAATWRLDQARRTWIVTLDEQARFSDGTPVTTADVVSSWGGPGRDGGIRGDARRYIESVVPVNARVIGITLRAEGAMSPRALADPALAIGRSTPGTAWPLGTTPFRVIAQRGGLSREAGIVTIAPQGTPAADAGADPSETVRFLFASGMDPRDRLDEQVDLLVSSDPSVLAYATTLRDVISVPLPWLRTHVLLSPGRAVLPQGAPARAALAPGTRQALAADAVRGEARGAEGPFWWESPTGCSPWRPTGRARPAAARDVGPRVMYRASDTVAGDLAERLLGLTAFDDARASGVLETLFPAGVAGLLSAGLEEAVFDAALASGRDRGYLLGLARRPLDPCLQLRALIERAGWLAQPGETPGAAIVPLVDTRARALVRRGRAGLTVDWDGVLVLAGVREARR